MTSSIGSELVRFLARKSSSLVAKRMELLPIPPTYSTQLKRKSTRPAIYPIRILSTKELSSSRMEKCMLMDMRMRMPIFIQQPLRLGWRNDKSEVNWVKIAFKELIIIGFLLSLIFRSTLQYSLAFHQSRLNRTIQCPSESSHLH